MSQPQFPPDALGPPASSCVPPQIASETASASLICADPLQAPPVAAPPVAAPPICGARSLETDSSASLPDATSPAPDSSSAPFNRNEGVEWLPETAMLVAWLVSMCVHLAAVIVSSYWLLPERQSAASAPIVEVKVLEEKDLPPELEPPEPTMTLADPSDMPQERVLKAEELSLAALQNDQAVLQGTEETILVDSPDKVPPKDRLLEGVQLDTRINRPGDVGLEVAHVDAAVDRITHEIARRLETDRVLVLWLMDASNSLVADREAVAKRLERIYAELDQLGAALGFGQNDELLGAVVSFGAEVKHLVPPTADGRKLAAAVRSVPVDESGIEHVFSAVVESLEKYKALRALQKRQVMVVIWTDESGDDYVQLERAVALCRKLSTPVFTVGPSAMLGQEEGTHRFLNPADGIEYDLPVSRGPDSVRSERIRMPYWFAGEQYDAVRSGVAPFALARLARESGGAYFINDAPADRSPYRLEAMRAYLPGYDSPNEYLRDMAHSPLRAAVNHAVRVTGPARFRGTPRLEFSPTGANFQTLLREAQQSVAFDAMFIEQALAGFGPRGLETVYQREPSPRWRAWYDLTLGRLWAMKVRCLEYNWACAELKGKGSQFVDTKSNRWNFRPGARLHFGSESERLAAEATRLLQRCIEQNPGTPWEQLARRELQYPLGWTLEESFVPPPPRVTRQDAPNNDPPNFDLREERPRVIPMPQPPKLPKL